MAKNYYRSIPVLSVPYQFLIESAGADSPIRPAICIVPFHWGHQLRIFTRELNTVFLQPASDR